MRTKKENQDLIYWFEEYYKVFGEYPDEVEEI